MVKRSCSHTGCKDEAVARYYPLVYTLPIMKACEKHEERHSNSYYVESEDYR